MPPSTPPRESKPFNIRERTAIFGRDIVSAAQFLQRRGPIGRELSVQILKAGTSVGSNVEEADGASSRNDFVAKMRIALKEAKETRFRLRTCRASNLLDRRFDDLIDESDQLVRIIATIVHNTLRGGTEDDDNDL